MSLHTQCFPERNSNTDPLRLSYVSLSTPSSTPNPCSLSTQESYTQGHFHSLVANVITWVRGTYVFAYTLIMTCKVVQYILIPVSIYGVNRKYYVVYTQTGRRYTTYALYRIFYLYKTLHSDSPTLLSLTLIPSDASKLVTILRPYVGPINL